MLALTDAARPTATGSQSVATHTDESTLAGKCCLSCDGPFSCRKKRQREEREKDRETDRNSAGVSRIVREREKEKLR